MKVAFKPYLPGVLALIAQEIGPDCAIALAQARGGRSLWIPKTPGPDHAVVGIVGLRDAVALSRLLGGGNVLIPCGNIGGAAGRRARIERLLAEGVPHGQIAAEVDVHIRTVERAAAALRRARDEEPSLFPDLMC